MVTLSPVTTPTINIGQSREQAPVREETSSKERLATTKPFGTAAAKSETGSERKNDSNQTFKLSESRVPDPSSTQGNRRGSLLDLSV